jgi:hypothetical protein
LDFIMATKALVSPVDTLILAAGKAAGTMYSKTLEAAKLARTELDASKPMADRIAAVMTAHAEAFKTAGHNVKAIFSDALTLHACAGSQVEIKGPKDSLQKMSASKAVETLAKNPMREAAKQVRQEMGIGRKVTPKVVSSAPKADATTMQRETLAEVAEHIKDAAFVSKLTTLLEAAGFILQQKATAAKHTRATRAPAPVKLADLMGQVVKGSAQGASA